jgi:hypothetical protein
MLSQRKIEAALTVCAQIFSRGSVMTKVPRSVRSGIDVFVTCINCAALHRSAQDVLAVSLKRFGHKVTDPVARNWTVDFWGARHGRILKFVHGGYGERVEREPK